MKLFAMLSLVLIPAFSHAQDLRDNPTYVLLAEGSHECENPGGCSAMKLETESLSTDKVTYQTSLSKGWSHGKPATFLDISIFVKRK